MKSAAVKMVAARLHPPRRCPVWIAHRQPVRGSKGRAAANWRGKQSRGVADQTPRHFSRRLIAIRGRVPKSVRSARPLPQRACQSRSCRKTDKRWLQKAGSFVSY